MRSLFQISDDLLRLADLLTDTDGEISEDAEGSALEAWFDALGAERDEKIDNYCALIQELIARADARAAESARLAGLAATDRNAADRLKERLKLFFQIQQIKRIDTARFRVAVQANGGKAPLLVPEIWEREPAQAPEEFHRIKIELDKDAIRTALEAGDKVDGAAIGERGSHLRIK